MQEVRRLQEEQQNAESEQSLASARSVVLQVLIQRTADEIKRYVDKDNTAPTLR